MKTGLFKIVLAVSVLALAALSCSVASPGGADGPANIPPTSIVSGGGGSGSGGNNNDSGNVPPPPPGNNNGRPLMQDDFRGRDSNWGTGTDSDSSVEYVDDALKFIVNATNYFVWSTPGDTEYSNVHIEVTVTNSSADPNGAFGIMCSQQFMDDEFYYVYVTASGDYGIVKSLFIEDDIDLATGSSNLIPQDGSSYTIGVDCRAGSVALYVNGQLIDTGFDDEYTSGGVALFAWSDDVRDGVTVSFDDFIITELK
jgi:hypothetical protein